MAATFFASDLHLAPERPECTETFLRFLRDTATGGEALYILGDLFEYWVGDEALDEPLAAEVAAGLKRLGAGGTQAAFMHGNRDFLVGERFASAAGVRLLPDPYLLHLHGVPTLLMHGDTLCTDDVEYLEFRDKVRNPAWQSGFLSQPYAVRVQIARSVRSESERSKRDKSMDIMDVSQEAVASVLRAHGYPRLIHGHTHRPARHHHVVDGRDCERIVLADWYEHGSCLVCDASGCRDQALS